MLPALAQHMVVQPAEQLEGHGLESQGRPVEQLHEPGLAVELTQRRHGAMAEDSVGLAYDPGEGAGFDAPGDERRHDALRQLGIFQAREGLQIGRRQMRPVLRHIETAVAGQTREQNVIEGERRGGAPGADVTQGGGLQIGTGYAVRGVNLLARSRWRKGWHTPPNPLKFGEIIESNRRWISPIRISAASSSSSIAACHERAPATSAAPPGL